ncbi:MAG: GDP-mannose 4,6-dehydratase, partial [Patescibacteria group bacterium]
KFSETTQFQPNSPYSASKAASDHLVRAYHQTYGLPTIITNCSNNYGPFQFPEKLIPLVITNLLEGKKIPVYGDGQNVRDWLYVEDHCRAIDLSIQKGKFGETYCIGGLPAQAGMTEDVSNLGLVKKIINLMGKNKSSIEFVKDRLGHDKRYAVDYSKATKDLGYKPQYDLDTYLTKTINWYQENQEWWQVLKYAQ